MAVIATIVMNLQVRNEAEAADAINEILRDEQVSFKAGSPLVDYRFDSPTQSPYGYFEANVQLFLNITEFSDAHRALKKVLGWQTREQVMSSSLVVWFETCLEHAEPFTRDYREGDAFVSASWGQLVLLDKNGLSDLLGVIDAALQGLDVEVLNLKPHERKEENYTQDDFESAQHQFDVANDLRAMILRKMAACEGESAEESNLPRRFKVDSNRLADRYHTTDLPDDEISITGGDYNLVAIDLNVMPDGGRMIYWSVEKPEFGVDCTVLFAESFADYRRNSLPEIRQQAIDKTAYRIGDSALATKWVDEVIRSGGMIL